MNLNLKNPINYGTVTYTTMALEQYYDGKLAVILLDATENPELELIISVNLSSGFTYTHDDCFFADVNNIQSYLFDALVAQGVIEPVGYKEQSGFVVYPAYGLSEEVMNQLEQLEHK